jgi:hypothetical protein
MKSMAMSQIGRVEEMVTILIEATTQVDFEEVKQAIFVSAFLLYKESSSILSLPLC